ncbi:hypothetical protein [Stutzerimonas stutzeri]|uniref:hypothetical protein n=1 Tax=Stutzerimonas stutzeri TaxID=316 RepID=UPI0030A6C451
MRLAQGNTRSKPDGFLHLWNFAATKGSGLAGALFNYAMTERQREVVETALIERAEKQDKLDPKGAPTAHIKHETWRFKKDFLMEHFKPVVYGTFKLFRRNASEQMAIKINHEYLATERAEVRWS